ncbi:hypothetical protein DOTSEDRAFT_180431 [Dothistroma septosporum NZE10]|uniref:NAD(P)-binding protein n=1 Tax=Dothistroma septosporum (strain NZE10 / CBS 128990) TaxID=675120 RepID=M2WL75_DOTSN|nr:hypothetical protein DOTSEDRAFT_180431 [Dothistroma septosporum NZE10]
MEAMPFTLIHHIATFLGTITLCRLLFTLAVRLYIYTKRSRLDIYRHCASGSWALVTGGTDGIGLGFTDAFLACGFNVLVHGRNPEKLERLRSDLQLRYPGLSIETVVADASTPDEAFQAVAKKAADLPGRLTVLVNNVGGQSTKPQHTNLWNMPHAAIESDMNINARFPTHLTRALMPLLRRNGPSLIANCGSVGGLFGIPYLAVYTATKAYIHTFTSAIKNEFIAERVANVDIIGFTIGNVISATNKPDASSFFTLSSKACAEGCIAQIGRGKLMAYPSWKHEAQAALIDSMPEFLWRRAVVAEMKKRVEVEKTQQ